MELVLEIVMGVLLDAAMGILVVHLLRSSREEKKSCRPDALTFAVGFAFGAVSKCFAGGSCAAMMLYVLGFMLAYTAFLFTLPEKRKPHEGR